MLVALVGGASLSEALRGVARVGGRRADADESDALRSKISAELAVKRSRSRLRGEHLSETGLVDWYPPASEHCDSARVDVSDSHFMAELSEQAAVTRPTHPAPTTLSGSFTGLVGNHDGLAASSLSASSRRQSKGCPRKPAPAEQPQSSSLPAGARFALFQSSLVTPPAEPPSALSDVLQTGPVAHRILERKPGFRRRGGFAARW
jgi:hypothetical protein